MTGPRRLLAILAAAACLTAVTAPAAFAFPNKIAAAGDSITQATDSCEGELPVNCPENSWSTGTEAAVRSLYLRIKERHREIEGQLNNQSVLGAKAEGLENQLLVIGRTGTEFLTIEIGANDACTETEAEMTSVESYDASILAGLRYISEREPGMHILVASVPDVYRLWSLLKNNFFARTIWNAGRICQSLLREPLAVTPEAEARRTRVRNRIIEYNEALRSDCASFRGCEWDGDAVFNHNFETGEVSTRDYFHPSVRGQETLARLEWEIASF